MASRLSRKKVKVTGTEDETTKASGHKSVQTAGASNAAKKSKPESYVSTTNELDMSSTDFSGGCSPFKYTAARAILKGQQTKRTGKKKDEGNTRSKSVEIKPSRSNVELQDSDGGVNNLQTENTDRVTSNIGKDVTDRQEEESAKKYIEEAEGKKCTTCSKVVPAAEFSTHTVHCLRQNFERKKTGTKGGVILFCQICQEELSALSDVERQQHYNRCLDSPNSDPQPAKHCHVCNKNLAHMNQTRKLQHINKCMDQAEALRKHEEAQEKAVEKARNKVLDCPLCGKHLKTNNSRQVHVKKCGRELGVPPDQVLARLHQQQQEHENLLSAGILPPEQNRRGRPPRRPTTGSSTSGTSAARVNVNRIDDDTALAIALSTSLKEEELRKKRTSLDDFNLPNAVPQRMKLTEASGDRLIEDRGDGLSQGGLKDAFSVLMSPTPVEKTKKRKKKKGRQHVPVLLVQTALEAREKLAQRFADLILPPPAEAISEAETPKFKASAVQEKYVENLSPRKLNPLWKKTALLPEDEGNFYVSSLTPHVEHCTLSTGSKIKKMSQIPGWKPLEPSPEKPKSANQTMLVSTQTAVLLAELADGNVTHALDQTRLLNQTGWLHQTGRKDRSMGQEEGGEKEGRKESGYEEQASGFFEEQSQSQSAPSSIQNPLIVGLQEDLSRMVNNSMASDITIQTQGDPIPTHSFILAARVPLLYKSVSDGRIDFSIYSRASVLALLKYLYTADVTDIQAEVLQEVMELANRFKLQELMTHCSKQTSDLGNDLQNDLDLDRSSHSKVNDTLQNLLKEMWGSDEDNSEEEEEEKENEEEEIEELYCMASQRKKEEETEESDEDRDENEEDEDDDENTETRDINSDNLESTEKLHNSRLSSGAIESLMKEWDSTESESDKNSVISRNNINETRGGKDLNEQDNESQNKTEGAESNQETKTQQHRSPKNSPSPVLIQSESDNELDNSGSDLFDSLTPVKSDCDNARIDNSPIISNVDEQANNVFVSEFNESSCSPVFTTQNCRPTQNVDTGNKSINLIESDDDLLEQNIEIPPTEISLTETTKKRKRAASSKADSTSILSPKRPRQDATTPRKETEPFKRARDISPKPSNTTAPTRLEEFSPEIRQKDTTPKRVSQNANPPKSRHETNQEDSTPKTVSQNANPQKSRQETSQKDATPKTVSQNLTHPKSRQEISPKAAELSPKLTQKKSPKRSLEQDFIKANLSQDLDTSPVFHRSTTLQISKQKSSNNNEALVDLTQDEEDGENDEEPEKETDIKSPESSCPPSQNFDGFCDVFEGYEEPEAYQEDVMMMMDVEPAVVHDQPNQVQPATAVSSDEELPDLRTVSKINLVNSSQPSSSAADKPESITINTTDENSQIRKVPEHREENGTAIDNREEEGTATQKSRKLKKFQFKSQKSSQSQKPKDWSPSQKQNTSKTKPLEPKTNSQDMDILIQNSQPSTSENHVSKESSFHLSQNSKDKRLTQTDAAFEDAFGSDDDGVLNMVMDEVEGVEEFDPPTDISMNVSTMDGSFKEPSVHPNLLKTPAPPAGRKKPLSEWQPPSPFTPMPQYDQMKTPDLKKHCTKIGIRALPKKKMVGLLKDVYARMHQYETDSDYEQPSPSSSKSDQSNDSTQSTNQQAAKKTKGGRSKSGKEAGKKKAESKKKQPVEETSDDTGLNESFEAKSSGTDLPEESIVISPTSSPVSKKDIAYKRKQVMEYIQTHDDVYLKILHYEPLEFDAFHQELKTAGVSVGKQLLLDLLDEKCVMFSLRGSRKPTKSRRRSPKKRGSPGKARGRGRGRPRGEQSSQSTQS